MRRSLFAAALPLLLTVSTAQVIAAQQHPLSPLITQHCLDCHDAETRTAGIDLATLLQQPVQEAAPRNLWIRIEEVIRKREMPPPDQMPLSDPELTSVADWFWQTYVLRDGRPHIGTTPLRRLTRYELQNTLEDVLAISLRPAWSSTLTGTIEQSRFAGMIPSDIPGNSGFDNDAQRLESLRPPLQQIADAIHFALQQFSQDPAAVQVVLKVPEIPVAASELESREFLLAFLQRVLRVDRVAVHEQTEVWHELYLNHVLTSRDSRRSLLHIFEMILVSPEFLYRLEGSRNQPEPYPVSGHELATRLSCFLWSSAPDAELRQLAEDGRLLQEDVLLQQVDRMLNSPRRLSLAENFAGQWLGFAELLSSDDYFRDERWNRETYDEILYFCDELIRADRSLFDLVQSDWSYRRDSSVDTADGSTAIIARADRPDVFADVLATRQPPRKRNRNNYFPPLLVKSQQDTGGGILTSPAIMRITAAKNRTSPIRRGVWVLNTLIGKRLEPPADVPPLDEARAALAVKQNPTVAELLQQHVSRAECISCHKAIDPLGLGLENFDSFGEWRDIYPDAAPVVARGIMPNGSTFETPGQMQTLLHELYQQEIAENFVRQMYAYALGRALEPHDRVSLERIMTAVAAEEYRVTSVIRQIVLSDQFRMRQDAENP